MTTTKMNINDVVDYIIAQHSDEPGSLSILKLQKLMYYVQAWHLAYGKGPLFEGKFQAWVHGPVNRQIYDRFKDSHSLFAWLTEKDISKNFDAQKLDAEGVAHINEILEAYGDLSGTQLEAMSHSEKPWIEARGERKSHERCETEIREDTMKSFYADLLAKADE